DDVMEHGTAETERDLPNCTAQCAPLARARCGIRIPGEELQLRGPGSERRELDGEPLDRLGRWSLVESRAQRCRNFPAVGGWFFEQDLGRPGSAALELRPYAHNAHTPSGATGVCERTIEQLRYCLRQHFPLGDRRVERERRDDRLGSIASSHRLGECS